MWVVYALLASIIWGFDYVLAEKLLKKISPATLLSFELFFATIAVFLFSLMGGRLVKDISTITHSRQTGLFLFFGVLTFALANVLTAYSIQTKNATLASLVEISYPLFIVLVGWILFREHALSSSVLVGGILIFIGIFVIFYFNK